jgi:hypothetical protein
MRNLTVLAVLLTVTFLSSGQGQAASDHIGIVKSVEGSAIIERGTSQLPVKPGDQVFNGDRIATAAESALGVTFKDGSLMSLGPDALMEMDELVYEPQNGKLSMVAHFVQGTFTQVSGGIARLKPEAVNFRTPNGTIGIRGTRFVVRVPK